MEQNHITSSSSDHPYEDEVHVVTAYDSIVIIDNDDENPNSFTWVEQTADDEYENLISQTIIEEDPDEIIESEYTSRTLSSIKTPIVADIIQMYKCPLCEFLSKSVEEFVEHHKNHIKIEEEEEKDDKNSIEDNKQMFLCGQCYSIFDSMNMCKNHMIKDHNFQTIQPNTEIPDNNNTPNYIKQEWQKPIPLRELKAKLTKQFVLRCTIKGCLYKFETEDKREKHISCHISSEFDKIRNFKCCVCDEKHKLWRDCTKHMWLTHKIDIDLLKCPVCDYKSLTSVQIFRHMQIHGTTKGYVCPVCSIKFRQASQLRYHSVTHLDPERKNLNQKRWYSQKKCDICGNIFANSKTLSKHIKVVHNKIKPFICNVCGYKSARKSTWMIHNLQHTGEKPYKCKHCDYFGRDPSARKKHELSHEPEYPYHCKFCEYKSVQSSTLLRHMQKYHPKVYEDKIKCKKCNFNSINEEALKRHIAGHKSGLIPEDDSNEAVDSLPKNLLINKVESVADNPNANVEISSDCFLPLESTDSISHHDTGGVTISEDTQFPTFMNS